MTLAQSIIGGVISLLLAAFVIELVRRRKLREEYSILWLACIAAMFYVSVSKNAVFWIAAVFDIKTPAYGLFVVAIVLGSVLAIHLTMVVSKLTAQNWRIVQEVALLRTELERLNQRLAVSSHKPEDTSWG